MAVFNFGAFGFDHAGVAHVVHNLRFAGNTISFEVNSERDLLKLKEGEKVALKGQTTQQIGIEFEATVIAIRKIDVPYDKPKNRYVLMECPQ